MARRVLFLAWAPFFSGAERALLMTLRSARPEPVRAGRHRRHRRRLRVAGARPRDHVRHHCRSRRSICQRPFAAACRSRASAAAALRFRPSIIHANDMPSYQPGGIRARMLGVPASRTSASLTALRATAGSSVHRSSRRYSFPRPSKRTRASAPDVFSPAKATVVYDAVELPRHGPPRRAAQRAASRTAVDRRWLRSPARFPR